MGVVHAKERNIFKNSVDSNRWSKEKMKTQDQEPPYFNREYDFRKKEEVVSPKPVDLQTIRARVDKVHISGLKRTKDDIIKLQVKELFKAQDFQDVIIYAHKVRGKLESLGCFQNIGVYIDTSKGPDATPDGVEVTFNVHELKHIMGSVNTMVGNNEGSLIVSLKSPNVFGRGERLQMEYSYGSKNSSNINVSAVKPFLKNALGAVLTGSVFSTANDFPWSGYNQRDNGILFNLEWMNTLKHNIQYEATYRKLKCPKLASFHVREQCGPNLKSAFKYGCVLDKRDDAIFPSKGILTQFSTEIAGFGGDIGFIKNEFVMQTNWTPFKYFTFQLGVQAGILTGVSNDYKISIADRFFLGGPLNIRGFDMRGCGPRRDGNAIGDDAYWATALHLYTPLPFRPGRNSFGDLFKLHGFINGGNLSKFLHKSSTNSEENKNIFTDDVRCSIGGGITMKLGTVARIELNIVMPLLYARSDIRTQFQFGIGTLYL